MGHFGNRLNLKEHSPDFEIFMDRNQIFQRKERLLKYKLFRGKKEKTSVVISVSYIQDLC